MVTNFSDGIITIGALSPETAAKVFDTIRGAAWKQAQVAMRYDGFRIKEIVDQDQRDALSVHPAFVETTTRSLVDEIFPLAKVAVLSCWGLEVRAWSSPQFTLYEKGHFIKAHRDSGDAFPDRLFTVVTYLTDTYEGGEIGFPATNLNLHPASGEALIFPSDYVHDVKAVTQGHKCVFLFFLDVR